MNSRRIVIKPIILTGGRNVKKNGETTVYIEVINYLMDGKKKTKRISTKVTVQPKWWNSKECKVKRADADHSDKNLRIHNKRFLVTNELDSLKKGIKINTPLIHIYTPPTKSLTDYIDDYIKKRKAKKTPYGTLKEFISCKNRLLAYQKEHYILHFHQMNFTFSESFCIWMMKENYSQGTIHKTFSILRTILNYYYDLKEELGIVMDDKFKSPRWKCGEPSRNEPKPLSEEEFLILKNYQFETESLNMHKDRFLFQCTTGMRFSDAFNICKENINGDYIEYQPVKTVHKKDNWVVVPINNVCRRLLEKYDYDMRKLTISNQKYNVGLAEMFKVLMEKHPDIFKQIYTSHNGRDTFVSNALNSDIDVPSLLKMVGQSSWSMMRRYARLKKDKGMENMKKIKIYDD